MVVNYNFILDDLHVAPTLEGHSQVVLKISWFLVGTAVDAAKPSRGDFIILSVWYTLFVTPGILVNSLNLISINLHLSLIKISNIKLIFLTFVQ